MPVKVSKGLTSLHFFLERNNANIKIFFIIILYLDFGDCEVTKVFFCPPLTPTNPLLCVTEILRYTPFRSDELLRTLSEK